MKAIKHPNIDGTRRKKKGTVLHIKSTDSDIPELHGMKGGTKALWLRNHREEILDYLQAHGEAETRRKYGIERDDVISEINKNWQFDTHHRQMSQAEIIKLQIAIFEADIKDLRDEIRQLKELFFTFRESVGDQLTAKFFVPLLQAAIRLDPKLEKPKEPLNPLDIKYLMANTNKKSDGRKNERMYRKT